jgi:hypothetical protein
MKKILLLIIITIFSYAMNAQTKFNPTKQKSFQVDPSYKYIKNTNLLNARSGDTACTREVLNMAFNYMTWGDLSGLNLNGNWYQASPEAFATTICSNLVPANDGTNHSVTMHYDTMITEVYTKSTFGKINKAVSYIKLDSLTIFGAVQVADTSNLASIANDSLIISTYLSNNGVLGSKLFDSIYTVANGGLKKFLFMGNFLGSRKVKYSHTFNKGESFAIQIQYRTTKVDTGFELCYCNVDSCNTVTFNGNQISSPATRNLIYPGLVKSQSVDSTAPSTAVLFNSNNLFSYSGLGFPTNCSFIYEQMYYIIPQITVCKELQGNLILSKDFPCYKDVTTSYAIISGGKPPYTYSWSTTGGVVLSSTNLDSANFTMTKTGGFSVNVTVTDAGTPPNSITLTKAIANYTPTFTSFTLAPNKTILSGCIDSISISVPSTTNTTYAWSGASSSTTRTALAKTAGIYSIKTTFTPSGCSFDSSITITSSATSIPTLDFTFNPTTLCVNKPVTMAATSAATKTGWTYSFKEGATVLGAGPSYSHTFTTAGSKSVTLTADSNGCVATPVTKSLTVKAATDATCRLSIQDGISDNIKVYPNPVRNGELFIQNEMNQSVNVKITDMLGKLITTDKVAGNKTNPINLSNSPNGIYFIELEGKGDKTVKKIVVEKQ